MQFVNHGLPAETAGNDDVNLKPLPAQRRAAIRLLGVATYALVAAQQVKLLAWLDYRRPAPEVIRNRLVDLAYAIDGLQPDRRFRKAARSLN